MCALQLKKCYNPDGDAVTSCAGKGAVLRISFGNFLFFAVHVLLTLGVRHGKNSRRLVHTGGPSVARVHHWQLMMPHQCRVICLPACSQKAVI